jgi:cyclophilin family peptidyl-prolyl cis-trans isomerase
MFHWIIMVIVLLALVACGAPTENTIPANGYGATPAAAAASPTIANELANESKAASRNGMYDAPPDMIIAPNQNYTARIETTEGTMHVELFPQAAPLAVNNFVFLAREGFYQDVKFHRIIKDFMVQSGDPLGNGTGGPGYSFEIETPGPEQEYTLGTVAMANTGQPNSNGSQFFIINTESYPLPKQYTIFGRITKGLDVLQRISEMPVVPNPMAGGEPSLPTEDVVIKSITIEER